VQPDAFVLLDQVVARGHKGPIDHTPQLCIEVLSTERAYDRVTKRFLYAEAGWWSTG
jgi:Uma2 family endonuclease